MQGIASNMKTEAKARLRAKLPNFLIVGAAKSGTTSLHYYLKQHPDIYMPKLKEPFFFSFRESQPRFTSPDPLRDVIWRFEEYLRLFERAKESQIVGEASPSYLYTSDLTIQHLQDVYGERFYETKIIILLREPSQRAWSQYLHFVKLDYEPLEFHDAIKPETIQSRLQRDWNIFYDYIGFGMYHKQVKAYMDNFSSVKIILFDDLKRDSVKMMSEIFDYLNVDSSFEPDVSTKFNVSGDIRFKNLHKFLFLNRSIVKDAVKPFIPFDMRKKAKNRIMELYTRTTEPPLGVMEGLREVFREDIISLQRLIGRDLSIWLN